MDWDSDDHQSKSEQMHDGIFLQAKNNKTKKRLELVKIL